MEIAATLSSVWGGSFVLFLVSKSGDWSINLPHPARSLNCGGVMLIMCMSGGNDYL
jgi:hypothetical protein